MIFDSLLVTETWSVISFGMKCTESPKACCQKPLNIARNGRYDKCVKTNHEEIKRNNEKCPVSFVTLTLTCIHLILLNTCLQCSAVDVQWEAKFPAVFGNVTYLHCIISDSAFNCNQNIRQWIGGPEYSSLCYEDKCPTSNKYEVIKQTSCLYTLMIHNFSEQDVNCEYTCSYGVSRMRRNLTLDEKEFIYEPQVKDIEESLTKHGSTLNWKINISKIFPTPSCGANLNGQSIKDSLQILVTKPGFYFQAALQINLPLSSCGKVHVYCKLGDYKINITNQNFDGCQFKGGEKSNSSDITLILILITSTIMIAVSVLMFCMYRKGKMCFNNNRGRAFQLYDGINVTSKGELHSCREQQNVV